MLSRRDVLNAGLASGLLAALPAAARAASPANGLGAVLETIADDMLRAAPETATMIGLDTGARAALAARLNDRSLAARTATAAALADYRRRLDTVDRAALPPAEQVQYDSVGYAIDMGRAGHRFAYGWSDQAGGVPYAVSQQSGAYQEVPEFLDSQHRLAARADVDAYLARLEAFAVRLDRETERLQHDAAGGVMLPAFLLATTTGQLRELRATPAAAQRMVTSLARRVAAQSLGADPSAAATAIVATKIYPALDRQLAALTAQGPKATADAGVWKLPDGDAYYRWQLHSQTTTDLDAATIHATGLRQNGELSAEMDALLKGQGLSRGSVGARMAALTADPKFLFPNTDAGRQAVVAYVQGRIDAIRPQLTRISKLGMQADIQVKRVPPDIQDGAALGYMNFAAIDGSRPAIYYVNLKNTAYWPKWTLASLTAHEAIPGHAWQGAYLAEHRAELPTIMSLLQFNAFVEGWALYAEQLVDESGFYADDPFGRLGYLQAQRFRAVRLVVDTGLHAQRWSRDKAIDYMVENTGRARAAVTSEIDRYCASPGQACGYKLGHNEILRQRARAQAALGTAFDMRDFNDALVRTGGAPLAELNTVTDRMIAQARRA